MTRKKILYILFFWMLTTICGNTAEKQLRQLPDNFMFGAASSAFQIEGAWNEDGKGISVWDIATQKNPSLIEDDSNAEVACNSYHLYKEDTQLLKNLGVNYYRFSISWSRILPNGFSYKVNQAGIKYYNNVINELISNDIIPFITIYHWDLPNDLQKLGGWANPKIVEWFADYAMILFDNFGDRVKYWITINEPTQFCTWAYGSDFFPPALNVTGIADYICAKNVLLAHAKVYDLYNRYYRETDNGLIGIAIHCSWFEPASNCTEDEEAANDAREFDWGLYVHPIFSKEGDFPLQVKQNIGRKSAEQGFTISRLPDLSPEEIFTIRGSADFLGINHYRTSLASKKISVQGKYPIPSYNDDMDVMIEPLPFGANDNLPEIYRDLFRDKIEKTIAAEQCTLHKHLKTTKILSEKSKDDLVGTLPKDNSVTKYEAPYNSSNILWQAQSFKIGSDSRKRRDDRILEAPWGLTKLLDDIREKYDNPRVVITENGWPNSGEMEDDDKISYISKYLNAIMDAIDNGSDVRGYTVWSLMDSFEWVAGYKIKFGLYNVDFTSPNRTRTPRKSAFFYKEIIESKQVEYDNE